MDPTPAGTVALLLQLDVLHPESLPLERAMGTCIGGLVAHVLGADERVRAAETDTMEGAVARASTHFGCPANARAQR